MVQLEIDIKYIYIVIQINLKVIQINSKKDRIYR